MKKLLVLLLLVPFASFGQVKLRDSVKVKTAIYEVMYSEVLEEPLWLKYSVQCPNGTASRAGMDFYTEKGIKTSDNADYVSNVYDKGHMAPAADFNCDRETLLKTFS
jgi:DNA/RNA endonuclease G (NUC1)